MQDKYFDESDPSLNNSVQHMHSTTKYSTAEYDLTFSAVSEK